MLNGSFRFRHVAIVNVDENYDPTEITASYGSITFDGAGHYTLSGTSIDNTVNNGAAQTLSVNGTYAIGSNGLGYLTNPLAPTDSFANIYGAVAQGVFTGSSTESDDDMDIMNDLFVAIPVGSAPSNASFTTPYQTGVLDFTGANSLAIKNALFELTPNGAGGFGAFTLNGQAANQSESSISQTVSGATYNFNSDGSATLTIPLPNGVSSTNALFAAGTKTVFQSGNGNFILGWTPGGYDIFFGVKALTTSASNSLSTGLYFTAAVEDLPQMSGADSYYGSTNNTGDNNGDGIVHQRLNLPEVFSTDFGTDDQTELDPDGTASDLNGYSYIFGDLNVNTNEAEAFVAIGSPGFFSLQIGLHAPAFSGSGVYLNPIGVANAASFQPITASISPGELLVLYGAGMAPGDASVQGGQVFPTTGLDGVTVTINNIPCPIYYVTPGQISAIVPYEVATNQTGLADIQVDNNGVKSNVVQMYLTDASPGTFSQGSDGIGFAAALHANYQEITADNPVQPGETIMLYMTGLGTVSPTITDGALGPSTTLSWADVYNSGNLSIVFNDYEGESTDNPGTITYAGLTPTLAGLYQLNVTVPTSGLSAGDNVYIEFFTDAANNNEIQIPYGTASFARPANRSSRSLARKSRLTAIRSRRSAKPRVARGGQ